MRTFLSVASVAACGLAAASACDTYKSCKSELAALRQTGAFGESLGSVLTDVLDARDEDLRGLPVIDTNKTWCPSASYFDFLPGTMAVLPPGADDAPASTSWTGICDKQVTATVSVNPGAAGTEADPVLRVDLVAADHDPLKVLCSDVYIVTTSFSYRFVDVSKAGKNFTATFAAWSNPQELTDIRNNGVRILQMPCGGTGTVTSVLKTVTMFDGSPEEIASASIAFLTEKGDWETPAPVPFGKQIHVPTDYLKSGDYMAVLRLDGLDPMIAWATGGHTGHSVVLVWDGPQLYAVESTAPNPFGADYWPCPTGCGIMRTKWEEWYPRAINASYHIGLLPLKEELTSQFDEDKFWSWFKTVEGMPYGYHSMLMSFLDTAPEANMPEPVDDHVFVFVLNLLEDIIPKNIPNNPVTMYSIFVEPLNKRLGTSCTTMRCIEAAIVEKQTTLSAATAIPEIDGTVYDGNLSMVCSEFAARVWQEGLGSLLPSFQGAEQTPKDNYQSAVFNPNRFNETSCPGGLTTTDQGTYCQIMGEYVLGLNDYNTIKPYENMNNACPSQWPNYFRCPASNPQCC